MRYAAIIKSRASKQTNLSIIPDKLAIYISGDQKLMFIITVKIIRQAEVIT